MNNTPASAKTLAQWDAELPEAPLPVASYIPCKQVGNLIFTSGMLPMQQGELLYKGRVGAEVSLEDAQAAARLCILNALSVIKTQVGSLANVKQVVKVTGFVMGTHDFYNQPAVINGASNTLTEVFGLELGQHARSAVGVANLPLEAPVEIELIVEV
jgi:enamine deaminase RidA (YjgF/YER057c/UK114 family)